MPTNEFMRVYMADRRRERKAALHWLLGDRCNRCRSELDLQIDHVDPRRKSINLSGKDLDGRWEALVQEAIHKCQLLCKPCHQAKTRADYAAGTIRYRAAKPAEHGTWKMYAKPHRCRCESCKQYKRESRRYAGAIQE